MRHGVEAEGLGPIFPISASLVASRRPVFHPTDQDLSVGTPVFVAPHFLNSEKLVPSAAHAKVNNRL